MISPKSDFKDYKDKTKVTPRGKNIVWAQVLDCRYGAEVERIEAYNGVFRIFDLDNDNALSTFKESQNATSSAKNR